RPRRVHSESVTGSHVQQSLYHNTGEWGADGSLPSSDGGTHGWGVDDSRSVEPSEVARDAVVTDVVLYRDEPADITEGDRVVVRGLTCEVVGRPATWRHPFTGWTAGFVVRANVVEG